MAFTGKKYDAKTALKCGLVDEITSNYTTQRKQIEKSIDVETEKV